MLSFLKYLLKKKRLSPRTYPNNTEILWNKGLAMLCDRYDFSQEFNASAYQNIKAGEIVWVKGKFIKSFFYEVFPCIKEPFVLVTGDSTISLPKEIESDEIQKILDKELLVHWFAQNCDQENSNIIKVTPLPLGIDFHSQYEQTSWRFKQIASPKEQELLLLATRDAAPKNKQNLAYADFQFNNSTRLLKKRDHKIKKDRNEIIQQLQGNPAVKFQAKRLSRDILWKEMAKYDFIISPHGSGLDCHRTWEALVLGSYVIVEKSVLDPLYQGLPVKILDDYQEITPNNLAKWKKEFSEQFSYLDYYQFLTNAFWFEKIKLRAKDLKLH